MQTNESKSPKSIAKWISVLYRKFQSDINKQLKDFGLNSSQYVFLFQLYRSDCVSQEELARRLHIDKSATARAIKQLEDNGFVTRQVNPEDKRSYYVCLTQKSWDVKKDLYHVMMEWNKKMTRNLSEDQYDMVYDLLQAMAHDVLESEALDKDKL